MNMNQHILGNYNTAVHSIIKDFVLSGNVTEDARLARIAVIQSALSYDASEGAFLAYTEFLLSILLDRKLNKNDADLCVMATSYLHKLRVSGMLVFENYQLNNFGETLIHSIAEAVTVLMPERLLPMQDCKQAPNFPDFRTFNIEGTGVVNTSLIKNRSRANDRRNSPVLYQALDCLWSEQYRLNEDMLFLTNLPSEYNVRKTIAHSNPAFADTFSFRYTLDSRGRSYARSIAVQPQGDSFSKAMLNLGIAKPLGAKGLNALGIHYANVSGHDKMSLQERVTWARSQGMVKAIDIVNACCDWKQIQPLLESWVDASKKKKDGAGYEEYAAAMEYYRATKSSDPTKYESNLVCHQDATNSGFQFGAALLGDLATAKATNLLPSHFSETPEDLYLQVACSVLSHLEEDQLATWSVYITRKSVKKMVMVTGYGAGKDTQLEGFLEGLQKVAGDNYKALAKIVHEISEALIAGLKDNAAALMEFSTFMKKHAKTFDAANNDDGSSIMTWTTRDGLVVIHAYKPEVSYGKGKYKIMESGQAKVEENKVVSSLPPNFIHSIDANMLRIAAIKARSNNLAFVPIHDSFGTHAGTFFDLGRILRQSFIEVMDYRWYANFISSNEIMAPTSLSKGEFAIRDVAKSTYMFS